MTDIAAKHNSVVSLFAGDTVTLPTPLDALTPRGKQTAKGYPYSFPLRKTVYINAPELVLVSGSTYALPVVAEPAPASMTIVHNADGTIYLRKDDVIAGISRSGGLRSTAPLPAGWPRTSYPKDDDGNQQPRQSAALTIGGVEYIEMGVPVDTILIEANGATFRFNGMEGAPKAVIGKNDGQTFLYEDASARYQIVTDIIGKSVTRTLTVTAKQKLTGRRIAAASDLSPGSNTPPTRITATAAIMGALAITSSTPSAVYGIASALDPRSFTQIPAKTVTCASKVRDNLVPFVGWTLPDLDIDQSDHVTWSVGLI